MGSGWYRQSRHFLAFGCLWLMSASQTQQARGGLWTAYLGVCGLWAFRALVVPSVGPAAVFSVGRLVRLEVRAFVSSFVLGCLNSLTPMRKPCLFGFPAFDPG